jgi:hypothetical protein
VPLTFNYSMSLQRTITRFGPASIRGGTPDSEESSGTLSSLDSTSNKLKKRSWAGREEKTPLHSPRQLTDRRGDEAPLKIPRQSSDQVIQDAVPSTNTYRVSVADDTKVEHTFPWESLQRRFRLELDDVVIIASRKDGHLVAVKEFTGPDADQKIAMLDRIRRENVKNLLLFHECFSYEGTRYAIFEHGINGGEKLSITLNHYALIAHYPTESQLATILAQVCYYGLL